MASLEKTIKKHLTESADWFDEQSYCGTADHHRTKSHVHETNANLYRNDTEDGRALKNYHSTRALLHRRVADAMSDLLDHVRNKNVEATNKPAEVAHP